MPLSFLQEFIARSSNSVFQIHSFHEMLGDPNCLLKHFCYTKMDMLPIFRGYLGLYFMSGFVAIFVTKVTKVCLWGWWWNPKVLGLIGRASLWGWWWNPSPSHSVKRAEMLSFSSAESLGILFWSSISYILLNFFLLTGHRTTLMCCSFFLQTFWRSNSLNVCYNLPLLFGQLWRLHETKVWNWWTYVCRGSSLRRLQYALLWLNCEIRTLKVCFALATLAWWMWADSLEAL